MTNEISSSSLPGNSFVGQDLNTKTLRSRYTRNFFVNAAWSFIIITLLGFTPEYIGMMVNPTGPQAHWFSHFHGALMSLWLLLFLVQAILARKGNLQFHKQLGLWSMGFGAVMWIAMIIAIIRPRIQYPGPVADERSSVLLIALHGLIFFGLFFTWGMLVRKKSSSHKRLMVLASIAVMQGSVDRLGWFLPWTQAAFFVRFVHLDLLLLTPLILYDLFTIERVHKITIIGGALIIAGQLAELVAEGTPTWQKAVFATFQPFVDPTVEVKLTDEQLAPLLGTYYGGPDWHATISREAGKLYFKFSNGPTLEMIAVSDHETSMTMTPWRVSFVKDNNGRVLKIINTQPDVAWELNKMSE